MGNEFMVNSYTAMNQIASSVAALPGGGFIVTWNSNGQDGSSYGVYGQVFGSSGNKIGGEFQINTYTIDLQGNSSVAGLSGDRFVVTWESGSDDASERDVYGRRFICAGGVPKDELVVEFSAVNGSTSGLWVYDREGVPPWLQLETSNPGPMTAVDIDDDGEDELVVALSDGLYTYDQINGWTLINSTIPEAVIPFRNGIACDFGTAAGVQVWDQTGGWRVLAFADADKMIAADTDGDGEDELIVSFSGFGLYIYDEASAWTRINSMIPSAMMRINLMN